MDWLRLWHDMPNDPKWRTIARVSRRPISEVMAVYCHLLVMASSNPDRGHVEGITCHDMSRENVTNVTFVTCHEINFIEGLSTALDIDIEHIEAILTAMQGRVLSGSKMSGWEGRQPKREDSGANESGAKSAAQRKREERERKKAEAQNPQCHDESHTVTQSHDREEERRGEKKDQEPHVETDVTPPCPHQKILALYHAGLPELPAVVLLNDTRKKHLQARWRENPVHQDLQFWADYFFQVKQSPFLLGQTEGRNGSKPFRASFDWLIAPSNFVKVIEGNYNA